MNGNLLLNERPLLIIPSLAATIGLHESIVLQQLHYWLQRSKNIQLDRKWVYFTYDHLVEQFPFFSKSTVRRLISNLEKRGLLSSDNFNRMKLDHTKWYTINYDNLHNLSHENTPSENQNEQTECSNGTDDRSNMNSPSAQSEQLNRSVWTAELVNLNSAIPEISPESTTENSSETSSSSIASQEKAVKEDPFQFFEQNGFGVIGSFIADKINAWHNDLSDELILEAMKLAVENASKRWSYVEAILRDWVDKGYQTVADVQAARLAYKEERQQHSTKKPIRQELIPDWLHNENKPPETIDYVSFEEKKRLFEERMKQMNEKRDIGDFGQGNSGPPKGVI